MLLMSLCSAQIQKDNPYNKAEATEDSETGNGDYPGNPGGNDPDPVPVDGVVPFLLITAMGVFAYYGFKKPEIEGNV